LIQVDRAIKRFFVLIQVDRAIKRFGVLYKLGVSASMAVDDAEVVHPHL
jgi:hypothetical protein